MALGLVVVAAALYVAGARRARPPAGRTAFFASGLAVVVIATASPLATYSEALLWVHMIQHLALVMLAAPLLLLGAPVRMARRLGRRRVTAALRGRVARALAFPPVAWGTLAAVLWGTHYSGLYDAALEHVAVHGVEHALYLGAALLFWFPVIGADPSARRPGYPARLLYLFLALPLNAALGLAIFSGNRVLYRHYATLGRPWGSTPLEDQQAAGAAMWILGGLSMLVALLAVAASWARRERAAPAPAAAVSRGSRA
jgi:putative copper resistance protein D